MKAPAGRSPAEASHRKGLVPDDTAILSQALSPAARRRAPLERVALSLLVGPKLSESRALTAELGNSDGAS
jgi:hypothetical protein